MSACKCTADVVANMMCRWSLLAMSDDVPTQQHAIRPLACALDGGKGNQDGNISYNVMVYHKEPMLCAVGWLAD